MTSHIEQQRLKEERGRGAGEERGRGGVEERGKGGGEEWPGLHTYSHLESLEKEVNN